MSHQQVNEADVHNAIKHLLPVELQGKIMGALRQIIDMHNPRVPTNTRLHGTPCVSSCVIESIEEQIEMAEEDTFGITFNAQAWSDIAMALKRDRAYHQALRYAGLQMHFTERGYAVKPLLRVAA